jgi:DNA-directed RNA polymerase sigma subunit (sigma70/sigma32)
MEKEIFEKAERSVEYAVENYNLPSYLAEDAKQEILVSRAEGSEEPTSYIIDRFYADYLEIPRHLKFIYRRQVSAMIELDAMLNQPQEDYIENENREEKIPSIDAVILFLKEKELPLPPEEVLKILHSKMYLRNTESVAMEQRKYIDFLINLLVLDDVEENILQIQIVEEVENVLLSLKENWKGKGERYFQVLTLLYGLYGEERHSPQEVAEKLNVSKERITQLHVRALRALLHPHWSKNLQDLWV